MIERREAPSSDGSGPGGAVSPQGGVQGGAAEIFEELASKIFTAAFSEGI